MLLLSLLWGLFRDCCGLFLKAVTEPAAESNWSLLLSLQWCQFRKHCGPISEAAAELAVDPILSFLWSLFRGC